MLETRSLIRSHAPTIRLAESANQRPHFDTQKRYTQEQADFIAAQNENAFDLPVRSINNKVTLLEHSRNPRAAMLDGKWPGEDDVTMTSLTVPIRFQKWGFAAAEEAMILEFVHDISNYVEGCITFIDDTKVGFLVSHWLFVQRSDWLVQFFLDGQIRAVYSRPAVRQ